MVSDVVEMAAFASIDTAAWLVSPIAGFAVLGVLLWIVAQALDGVKVTVPRPRVKLPRVRIPKPTWPKAPHPGAHEA